MKTQKIAITKTLVILLLGLVSNAAFAQKQDFSECSTCTDNGFGRFYVSPLNLLNKNRNSFQLTYGKTIGKRFEIQFNAWKIFPGASKLYFPKVEEDKYNKFLGGNRFGIETQYVLRFYEKSHIYTAIEVFSKIKRSTGDGYFNGSYTKSNIVKGLNFKIGTKQFISKKAFVDLYIGVSINKRIEEYHYLRDDRVRIRDKNLIGQTMRGRVLPWNIKFGYTI